MEKIAPPKTSLQWTLNDIYALPLIISTFWCESLENKLLIYIQIFRFSIATHFINFSWTISILITLCTSASTGLQAKSGAGWLSQRVGWSLLMNCHRRVQWRNRDCVFICCICGAGEISDFVKCTRWRISPADGSLWEAAQFFIKHTGVTWCIT